MAIQSTGQPSAEQQPPAERSTVRSRGFTVAAAIIFGVLFPAFILAQAFWSMQQLSATLRSADGFPLLREFATLKEQLHRPEDYMLASQVLAESASQRTMINKQVMKASAMHVGFATMSLGMMLVLLGFKEYQQRFLVSAGGFTIDLRRVTSGALVFVAGSAMTAAAALVPNEYRTVAPFYFGVESTQSAAAPETVLDDYTRRCAKTYQEGTKSFADCLHQMEEKRIADLAKSGSLDEKTCVNTYQQRPVLLSLCKEAIKNVEK